MVYVALKRIEEKKPNWLSRMIGLRTYSPYSHIEVIVGDLACSSVFPKGVRITPAKGVLADGHWDIVPMPFVNGDLVLAWFREHEGAPYDTRSLVEILAGKPSSDPRAFNCAESVVSSVKHAGWLLWFDGARATPESVALAARALREGVESRPPSHQTQYT